MRVIDDNIPASKETERSNINFSEDQIFMPNDKDRIIIQSNNFNLKNCPLSDTEITIAGEK